MENEIKISEIFYSVQGEAGPMFGKPCIFIRTSGCSLKCTKKQMGFDCDTPYHENGTNMTIKQIINQCKKYPCTNIVLTGGSPEIQPHISELIHALHAEWYYIQIETNGLAKFPDSYKGCFVVCSPKINLLSKRKKDKWFFNPDNAEDVDIFKFVYVNNGKNIMSFGDEFDCHKRIYIMPEGTKRNIIINHSKEVIEFCKKYGYNFSPREHVIIWNGVKGV